MASACHFFTMSVEKPTRQQSLAHAEWECSTIHHCALVPGMQELALVMPAPQPCKLASLLGSYYLAMSPSLLYLPYTPRWPWYVRSYLYSHKYPEHSSALGICKHDKEPCWDIVYFHQSLRHGGDGMMAYTYIVDYAWWDISLVRPIWEDRDGDCNDGWWTTSYPLSSSSSSSSWWDCVDHDW